MERITATFHFTENYQHSNWSQQEAKVKLDVDYQGKTFSITPYHERTKNLQV